MGLFRSSEILGIARETLEFALQAAHDSHPNEFMGLLRGKDARKLGLDRSGTVITDVLIIPGTKSNSVSATVKTSMIPNDVRSSGSIHSHPNGVLQPSDTDLASFSKGDVNIIVGHPYRRTDWRAFDRDGKPRDIDVLDVDIPDEEFLDSPQEDANRESRDQDQDRDR